MAIIQEAWIFISGMFAVTVLIRRFMNSISVGNLVAKYLPFATATATATKGI